MTTTSADGQVVLITGGARGIGATTAQLLASRGAHLVLFDRCADDNELTYGLATQADMDAAVAACDGRAIAVTGDVRSVDDLRGAVDAALETYGHLDAVVAAAGVIAGGSPLWETPEAIWDTQLAINLTGVYNAVRAAVPALLDLPKPRHGRVVAVSSAAGLTGNPQLAAYNASKAAVIGLVKGLAADLADTGITANAVCPGSTRTSMLEESAAIYDLESIDEFAVHHLTGRLLDPIEVAEAIAWLVSTRSSGMTGAIVPIDAGMSV